MKKTLALLLSAVMLIGTMVPASAVTGAKKSESPSIPDGAKMWFDAQQITANDGDKVALWENLADSSHNAKQEAPTSRPTYVASSTVNDRPGVKLDKMTFLEVTDSAGMNMNDMSVFAVINAVDMDKNGDNNQIFSKLSNVDPWEHNWYFNISNNGFNFGWKDAGGWHDYGGANRAMTANTSYILGGVKSGSDGKLYMNGKLLGVMSGDTGRPNALPNKNSIYIGANHNELGESMNGVVGEIIAYDRGLSKEETAKINEYLSEKWGIEAEIDLSELKGAISVDGEEIRAFSPNDANYKHVLAKGTTAVPVVTADFSKIGATVTVEQATALPGTATVTVKVGSREQKYTIEFSTLDRELINLQQPQIEDVEITDGFWKDKIDLFKNTSVDWAFDNFENAGTLDNFKNVGKPGARPSGNTDPWNDGLLFETIRGVSDFLRVSPDPEVEARIDEYIDIVYDASMKSKNGYLSTWAMMEQPGKYFDATGNARWYHDAYNFGCMAEAAVHYYKATGKVKLLYVTSRFADFLTDNYGYGLKENGEQKINMVPSHEGPEEMLLKLYQLYRDEPTLKAQIEQYNADDILSIDENEYADLVKFWIENRGNYDNRVNNVSYDVYAQDHARYFDQDIAAGHAVRANLFYTGMAAAGREFADYTYLASAEKIWQNIVDKQMYITGGVGAQGADEAYGPDYDLPNNGYCETCAQAAMGFFSENMALAFGEAKYSDIVEKYLYDGVLGSFGADGKSFFYQQPLTDKNRPRMSWTNHTPCCVPMFFKFYAEIQTYIYAFSEDSIYANQFISSNATIGGTTVTQETTMPWAGETTYTFSGNSKKFFVRLPEWADAEKISIQLDGADVSYQTVDGYAVLDVTDGSVVKVVLPMEARREYSNENVVYNQGKVALAYGPMVYCVEDVDNVLIPSFSKGDGNITVPTDAELSSQFEADLLGGIQTITFPAQYYDGNGKIQTITVKAIPFYARANRGNSATFVWIDEELSGDRGVMKRWLASVTNARNGGNSAAAAFDGRMDTYWSAGSAELPQALIVDLGELKSVETVKTTFTSAQAWKYVVLTSQDGENWTEFANRSENANNQQEYIDTGAANTRYITVKFVESAGVGYISVKDIAVMAAGSDENLAKDKLCASSSTSNVGDSVFAMLDGDPETRYCPPNGIGSQTATMDMGEIADITGIHILFEKTGTWDYRIELSDDGITWNPYFSEVKTMTEKMIEQEATGRYVRFNFFDANNGATWPSAWEFDVKTKEPIRDIFSKLFGEEPPKPDAFEVKVSDIGSAVGKIGSTFSMPVNLTAFPMDAQYKAIEGVVTLPDGVDVSSVVPSVQLSNASFESNLSGNTLRFAFVATDAKTPVLTFDPELGELLTVNMALTAEKTAGDTATIAFERLIVRASESSVTFDVSKAGSSITFTDPTPEITAIARELYVGDGIDLIPENKKAIAVEFTGIDGTKDVSLSGTSLYFSSELTAEAGKSGTATYVAYVDVTVDTAALSGESFVYGENASQTLIFGDTDGTNGIDAQDALKALRVWLRKDAIQSDKEILIINVNADGRLDTSDAIEMVDFFTSQKKLGILSK